MSVSVNWKRLARAPNVSFQVIAQDGAVRGTRLVAFDTSDQQDGAFFTFALQMRTKQILSYLIRLQDKIQITVCVKGTTTSSRHLAHPRTLAELAFIRLN